MREAIHNMTYQTIKVEPFRLMHPVSSALELLFGMRVNMGSYYNQVMENSRRLNAQVNKYIQRRKSGLDQSKMQGYDLLSVFLEDQTMFPDEKII